MPVTCTPASLAEAAKCFNSGYGHRILNGIKIKILCNILNSVTMDCDVDTLAEASKCFVAGLSDEQLDAIQVYLLCQVANGGSSGGGGISNGSGDPTADPTDTSVANLYINDDTGTIWEWPAGGPAWVQRT